MAFHAILVALGIVASQKTNLEFTLESLFKEKNEIRYSIDSEDQSSVMSAQVSDFIISFHKSNNEPISKADLCRILAWRSKLALSNRNWDFQSQSLWDLTIPVKVKQSFVFEKIIPIDCDQSWTLGDSIDYANVPKSLAPLLSPFLHSQNSKIDTLLPFITYSKKDSSLLTVWNTPYGKIINELKKEFAELGWEFSSIGKGVYEHYILSGLKEVFVLNFAFTFCLFLLFKFFFGTWWAGFIGLIPLVFTGLTLQAAMALSGTTFNLMTSLVFLSVSLANIEDFIFISAYQQKSGRKGAFLPLMAPCFFTSLTTFIGFGCLIVSPVSILREFGIWTAVGSLLEWYGNFFVLPGVLYFFPKFQIWSKQSQFVKVNRFLRKHPKPYFKFILIGLFILSLPLTLNLNFNESPHRIFPKNHPINEGQDYFLKSRGWMGAFEIKFQSKLTEEARKSLQSFLHSHEIVGYVQDSKAVANAWVEPLPTEDRNFVLEFLKRKGALDQFVDKNNQYSMKVFVNSLDSLKLRSLIVESEDFCLANNQLCRVEGDLVSLSKIQLVAPQTLWESLIISLALVFLIISFLAKAHGLNFKSVLALGLSSTWSIVITMGVLALTRIELNLFSSIFASILVGLMGDNAIQYLFSLKKRDLLYGSEQMGIGTFYLSLALVSGSVFFLFSDFIPIKTLGLIFILGFTLAFVGDYWGLRVLLINQTRDRKS